MSGNRSNSRTTLCETAREARRTRLSQVIPEYERGDSMAAEAISPDKHAERAHRVDEAIHSGEMEGIER
jgi:ribosomal protein L21E